MRNDYGWHAVWVGKVIVELLEVWLPITLLPDLFGLIVEIQRSWTSLQFSQELLPSSANKLLKLARNMATLRSSALRVGCWSIPSGCSSGICGGRLFCSSIIHSNQNKIKRYRDKITDQTNFHYHFYAYILNSTSYHFSFSSSFPEEARNSLV